MVSLTPVKLSKMVKAPRTSVVDTGEEFLTGIKDNGEANFTGVVDTCEAPNLSTANNTKKLTLFLCMAIGTKRSSLTKKNVAEKSLDSVPLHKCPSLGSRWLACVL